MVGGRSRLLVAAGLWDYVGLWLLTGRLAELPASGPLHRAAHNTATDPLRASEL